jgi:hypothetical protein
MRHRLPAGEAEVEAALRQAREPRHALAAVLGQLPPVLAAFSEECVGQLAAFGPA